MFLPLFLLLCNLGISLTSDGILFEHGGAFFADIEAKTGAGAISFQKRIVSDGRHALQLLGIERLQARAFPDCEDTLLDDNVLFYPEEASERVINTSRDREVYQSNENRRLLLIAFCIAAGLLVWHEKNQVRCKNHS
ncbi:hypothetical protein HY501_01175 [Candidatus Woesearchaeota archaeon]|nr:hypothetical protein [Candidatus Woesearchaeota archaeon]